MTAGQKAFLEQRIRDMHKKCAADLESRLEYAYQSFDKLQATKSDVEDLEIYSAMINVLENGTLQSAKTYASLWILLMIKNWRKNKPAFQPNHQEQK